MIEEYHDYKWHDDLKAIVLILLRSGIDTEYRISKDQMKQINEFLGEEFFKAEHPDLLKDK